MDIITGIDLIDAAYEQITEMDIHQLKQSLDNGEDLLLVDIRERDEWAQGRVSVAHHISRGRLEFQIENLIFERDVPLALMCANGVRTVLAARTLQEMGYQKVYSITGGFNAWKNAGYPFDIPRMLNDEQRDRYSRHTLMPEISDAGQLKLLDSKVLIIGAGGLGSPAAIYLAAAGVGTIGLVDFDVVDASNLQRQIIHRLDAIDTPKVESARRAINQLNPDVKVIGYNTQLTSENAPDILRDFDLVVNGSDNFPTRYLVNDACVLLEKPLVDASIFRFDGQVTVYDTANGSPCYRCRYPDPPPPGEVPSCAEGGVLGALPGVIGSLQAVEAIKLLLNIGAPLTGRALQYDALEAEFREFRVRKNPHCPVCGDAPTITELIDYQEFCGIVR